MSTPTEPTRKTAFSGIPMTLRYYYQVNPDCTSGGMPVVTITQPASHGSVAVRNDADQYPDFPSTNQRYECNKKKTPSASIVYTPEKAFVGTDTFLVKVVFPTGNASAEQFEVTVDQPHDVQSGAPQT